VIHGRTGERLGRFRVDFRTIKLLEDTGDGTFTEPGQRGSEHQARSIAIARWVIEIGDPSCSKAPENIRAICLPSSVVALADKRTGKGVQNS